VTEIDEYDPKIDRVRVLEAVYEALKDDTMSFVNMREVRDELGLSDERAGNAANFLEGEGLIKVKHTLGSHTPMLGQITHRGVKTIEESKAEPTKATEAGLAPYSVIINGNVIGSAFQQGSPGATQHYQAGDITVGTDTKKAIADFVAQFEAQARKLVELGEQTQADVDRMSADVATMKAQAASPAPKKHFLAECKNSIKSVLEHGIGGMLTVGLLALVALIHL
jgi:hypothetical protein